MNLRIPFLAAALALLAAPAAAQDIVALCIGNDAYHKPDDVLDTPVADATLMRDTLRSIPGVRAEDVVLLADGTRETMRTALRQFREKARGARLAIVFYSGHGMEDQPTGFDRAETFLLPVDAVIESTEHLPDRAVGLGEVLGVFKGLGPGGRVVVLDCCRTGAPSATKALAGAGKNVSEDLDARVVRALGQAELSEGTLVAFSAGPGRKAAAFLKDTDAYSPFTHFLAKGIREEGGDLFGILSRATATTREATAGRQIPRMRFDGDPSLISAVMLGASRAPIIRTEPVPVPPGYSGEMEALKAQLAAEQASGTMVRTDPVPTGAFPAAVNAATRLSAATKEAPFVNNLGLEFVPVPGKSGVWMCRTETRVQDFRAYAEATDYVQTGGAFVLKFKGGNPSWGIDEAASWEKPGFEQSEDHPVVCVSWEEARTMAAWLSQEEPGLTYRLPTDAEWSAAVGSLGKYPWGNAWPPPEGAGNYFGKEAPINWPGSGWKTAYDHDDGAERTARIAQYAENRFGFFDLGGNVFEWCEDPYRASMNDADALEAYPFLKEEKDSEGTPYRVLRGGSWSYDAEIHLRSSYRGSGHPAFRRILYGFRLVVSVGVGG
jgi:formylglycine-generating enzyme required for sulfatase activity